MFLQLKCLPKLLWRVLCEIPHGLLNMMERIEKNMQAIRQRLCFSLHRSNRIVTSFASYHLLLYKVINNKKQSLFSQFFPMILWHTASKWNTQLHVSLCDHKCSPFALYPNSYILLVPACLLHWESHFYWLPFQASFNMIHIHLWISTFPCCPDISAINTLKSSPWKDMKCYKGK